MNSPVGGRIAARRRGSTGLGGQGFHVLEYSTTFSTIAVDDNPGNNHPPVTTPLNLFRDSFDGGGNPDQAQ